MNIIQYLAAINAVASSVFAGKLLFCRNMYCMDVECCIVWIALYDVQKSIQNSFKSVGMTGTKDMRMWCQEGDINVN